jgi:selenocysteine lyase/cysteine desulfurase
LEAGTLAFPAISALFEGALYLKIHQTEIQRKLFSLTTYCIERIKTLPLYRLFSLPNPCGIVAFQHENYDSDEVADILSERFDIAVRGGLHCAPLAHRALSTYPSGMVRASFSHYTSTTEIDELITALSNIF